ncbi:MAG: NfeD family protein, partial [Planctomycetota bacterium]
MKSLRALMFGLIAALGIALGLAAPSGAQVAGSGGAGDGTVRVAVVPIATEIDLRAATLAKRAVERAIDQKLDAVLIELSTPGGRLDYMMQIGEAVDAAREAGLTTICWVKGDAASAGVFIAMACDRIYMSRSSMIGSATPIVMGQTLDERTHEKIISYGSAKFRARAQRTGQSAAIAQAMVDADMEVIEVLVDGSRTFVSRIELDRLYNTHGKDRVIQVGVVSPKGKVLALTGEEAVDFGVAVANVESRVAVIAQEFPDGADEVLFEATWAEDIAAWITSPGIRSMLFIVGLVGLYMEVKAPGLSLPGLIGVLCFAAFFFGHMTVGLADAWEVIFFLIGVVLLLVEVFVIPGFGVAGVVGVTLMIGSLIMAQVPDVWTGGDWGGLNWRLLLSSAGQTTLSFMLSLVGMAAA